MLTLNNLSPHPGSTKSRKRVGRGPGSGSGKTAARGQKGYKSRSGSSIKPTFEGGQMPLHRRLPKRGFNNVFKKDYSIVNVQELECFAAGTKVDREALIQAGLIDKKSAMVKVLGNGEIKVALNLAVDKVSASARQKIEAVGGTIEG